MHAGEGAWKYSPCCTTAMPAAILGLLPAMTRLSSATFTANSRVSSQSFFCLLALLATGVALQINGYSTLRALLFLGLSVLLCAAALRCPRVALELPAMSPLLIRRMFLCALFTYLILNLLVLRFRHHEPIDVILWEEDSAHTLLHGGDPYGRAVTHVDVNPPELHLYPGIAANGVVHVGFTYPPLALLWVIPSYLAGDVRYSSLLAVGLAGILMFYLAPNVNGLLASLLILFVPQTSYVLRYGYTDPLVVVTLALTIGCALKAPRWLPFALGLFFASKQYTIVTAPLAAVLLTRFSWKRYFLLMSKAGAIVIATLLPFALWDPVGLWFGLVGFHMTVPLRADALTVTALLATHGLRAVPGWFAGLTVLSAIGFALKYSSRTPAGFAISVALVTLVAFMFSKQAFAGYYFYCAGALCLGLAASDFDSASMPVFGLVRLPSAGIDDELEGVRKVS